MPSSPDGGALRPTTTVVHEDSDSSSEKSMVTVLSSISGVPAQGSTDDLDALETETLDQSIEGESFLYTPARSRDPSFPDPLSNSRDAWKKESTGSTGLGLGLSSYRITGREATPVSSVDFIPLRESTTDISSSSYVSAGLTDEVDSLLADRSGVVAPERKLGDQIPSVNQRVDDQDKLYESLHILDDVKKLKESRFFGSEYNERMNELKRSQLQLLVDMTQMNEDSFQEFYKVWETIGGKYDGSTEMLDINNSATFRDVTLKNEAIAEDVAKIRSCIAGIDLGPNIDKSMQ